MRNGWVRGSLIFLVAAAVLAIVALLLFNPLTGFERDTLNPGRKSDLTPASLGVPFERVSIQSRGRKLDSFLVRADPACPGPGVAVLVFHGRNETIADWVKVQQYLRRRCVTSLVFDYAGHGQSEGLGSVAHLNEDARAAISYYLQRRDLGARRCLLAHSMGNAVMLDAVVAMARQPDCLVLANPFASLKTMALANGLPSMLAFKFPDVWDNTAAAKGIRSDVLWTHSSTDQTVPVSQGRVVFDNLRSSKRANVISGFDHNAIYKALPEEIWSPIIRFIQGAAAERSKDRASSPNAPL